MCQEYIVKDYSQCTSCSLNCKVHSECALGRIITSCQGGTARRGEPLFFGTAVLLPSVPVVPEVLEALSVWNYIAQLYSAHCVLCAVYFSVQPNKHRPILKFKEYYPIEHIFVPA